MALENWNLGYWKTEKGKGENGKKASLPFLLLFPFAFLAVAVFGILQL